MLKKIHSRYRYSYIILLQLVKTDFKIRYQSSFLGYLWSLLRPLAIFSVLYVVFTRFLPVGNSIQHYPAYLLLGIVLWNFFVEITNNSVSAIVNKGDLIRKINFPKYVIILAVTFSALINLCLNLLIVFVLMIISDVAIGKSFLLFPLVVAELYVFSLACGFILSTLFVRFRDIVYIWEVVLQVAFYATPILYPLNVVPNNIAKVLLLSPVAQTIQDARKFIITDSTINAQTLLASSLLRFIPFFIVVMTLLISVFYFKKKSKYFAEEV